MSDICVNEEMEIAISAEQAYRCISDYQRHHEHILPPAFSDYTVERGGVGAGTVVRFSLKSGGSTRSYRMEVSEPNPGQILVETDPEQRTQTTFTVSPTPSGSAVRIETCWEVANPIRGFIERLLAPLLLREIYRDELRRLEAYGQALEAAPREDTDASPSEEIEPTAESPVEEADVPAEVSEQSAEKPSGENNS